MGGGAHLMTEAEAGRMPHSPGRREGPSPGAFAGNTALLTPNLEP